MTVLVECTASEVTRFVLGVLGVIKRVLIVPLLDTNVTGLTFSDGVTTNDYAGVYAIRGSVELSIALPTGKLSKLSGANQVSQVVASHEVHSQFNAPSVEFFPNEKVNPDTLYTISTVIAAQTPDASFNVFIDL